MVTDARDAVVSQDRPAVSVPIRPGRRDGVVDFDLMILDGGSAGFAAAIAACDTGKRVALANTGPLGGTCTNRGCRPQIQGRARALSWAVATWVAWAISSGSAKSWSASAWRRRICHQPSCRLSQQAPLG